MPANHGKALAVVALLKPYRLTLAAMVVHIDKALLAGEPLPKYCPSTGLFDYGLSARQTQTAWTQARDACASWLGLVESAVRKLITDSNLDDATKTVLYRVNARHAWWAKSLYLSWLIDPATGELVVCSAEDDGHVMLPVSDDDLALARALVKHARSRQARRPNLLMVTTLRLDAKVAQLEASSDSSFPYWLKVATLNKGHPTYLPVKHNPYLDKQAGVLLNVVQLHIGDNGALTVAPIVKQADAPLRTEGEVIGIDWGVYALFATSDGRLLGRKMAARLRELDKTLTAHAADLQKRGVRLKSDRRYRSLSRRISAYVKNEVGRDLNKIADTDVMELVVEKLNFRFGGLSRQMNRVISRAGRSAVEAKLSRLRETRGIANTHVNPAYTSQECARCGHISKSNRPTQARFKCKCCGHRRNADVNAAQSIKERRSLRYDVDSGRAGVRHNLRDLLLERHTQTCPTGAHRATVAVTGATAADGTKPPPGRRPEDYPDRR